MSAPASTFIVCVQAKEFWRGPLNDLSSTDDRFRVCLKVMKGPKKSIAKGNVHYFIYNIICIVIVLIQGRGL